MKVKCPGCHATYSLDAAVDDEAAREFSVVMADLPRDVSRPLLSYVALFRSASRSLAWDRALRLAREALALSDNQVMLGQALVETVESLRGKQQGGGWKPLTGHNYLKRVLENQSPAPAVSNTVAVVPTQRQQQPGRSSQTRQVVGNVLERYSNGSQ